LATETAAIQSVASIAMIATITEHKGMTVLTVTREEDAQEFTSIIMYVFSNKDPLRNPPGPSSSILLSTS